MKKKFVLFFISIILYNPFSSFTCYAKGESIDRDYDKYIVEKTKYSPEMYGAIGDGNIDDSHAINAAIIQAASKNGVVEFDGSKFYHCENPIELRSNVVMELNGCYIDARGVNIFDNDRVQSKEDYHDIIIRHGFFIGTNSVAIAHTRDLTIENCVFLKCAGNHFIEVCASKGVVIKNCSFLGQQSEGGIREMIQLDVCEPSSFRHYTDKNSPLYDYTPIEDLVIENCYFSRYEENGEVYPMHCAIGGHVENPIQNNNLVIRDCVIDGSDGNGIFINNWNGVLVENCIIKNTVKYPIGLRYSCNDVTIIGNTIDHFSEKYAIIASNSKYIRSNISILDNLLIPYGNIANITNCNNLKVMNNKNAVWGGSTQKKE